MRIKLGTRSSRLALAQARLIARLLKKTHRGLNVELVEILTTGDQSSDQSLHSFGGAGIFVKELERALLDGRVDIAVHSLKDLPIRQPCGLTLAAVVGREDPRDAAIVRHRTRLENLRAGSIIGSGSPRRRAQLKHYFPHLEFAEIRGNVETRIRKVEEGRYAGTILARAGLRRLNLTQKITQTLSLNCVLPAPGQGALALECRARDARARRLLKKLNNIDVAACVTAERATLEALGGGCHLPLGALATIEKVKGRRRLRLRATLGLPDGSKLARVEDTSTLNRARALGRKVARLILAQGGQMWISP
ncbi:MAG: hydroxymethylbilane synthase [Planctomycetota bacterium]